MILVNTGPCSNRYSGGLGRESGYFDLSGGHGECLGS